jgi:hypothetical protein
MIIQEKNVDPVVLEKIAVERDNILPKSKAVEKVKHPHKGKIVDFLV